MMKLIRWVLPILSFAWLSPAFAQSNVLLNFQTTTGPVQASAVNPLPVAGTFSATLSPFTPGLTSAYYTHLTATGSSSASTALPTNTGTVVITNEGTTPVSCTFASGAATGVVDNIVVAAGNGGRGVGVPATADHIACIDQNAADSTSNLVVIEGGIGLPAGWGGGGGGSGGAVTIASSGVASGAYASGAFASGAFASGSVASGAFASGSLAAGSMVDLLTMRAAIGGTTGSPADVLVSGCQYLVSAPTYTTGDSGAVQCTINGYPIVSISNVNPNGQAIAANSSPVVAPVLTVAGAAVVKGGVPVVNGASFYQTQAASTTITALTGGSGGATGDYLSHCTVIPTSTSPGVFTITDNATAIYSFPGGASSLSNLVPFTIPVGANSVSGAWKITTGAGLS
ncbi:MAG: hypothetical protein ACLP3R_10165, partial [Candidatus Korobacteraceae bacterium]